MTIAAPIACPPHLSLGITGHRSGNAAYAKNRDAVDAALAALFDHIDTLLDKRRKNLSAVRFHSLLVDGVDQITAQMALDRGWELVAPLPFGNALNIAINAQPKTAADARLLAENKPASDPVVQARAQAIRDVAEAALLFELADRDAQIAPLFFDTLESPGDLAKVQAFQTQTADQASLAGKVMLERCDLLIAVWDGQLVNMRGGTGHTVVTALEMGTPVLLIDIANPREWSVLSRPEKLLHPRRHNPAQLEAIITASIGSELEADASISAENWHPASARMWHLHRRIEASFGGGGGKPFRSLKTYYETPDAIAAGSAADLLGRARDLPNADNDQIDRIATSILPQFAWADGISSWLSDAYRSGMGYNFILSALAVVIGAAYLPWDLTEQKWIFASIELLLLVMIIVITFVGSKRRWHTRWFETRRVAEYLRHGPIMLLLGVSRPLGRWPRGQGGGQGGGHGSSHDVGQGGDWPENFSRHCLRAAGLPAVVVDREYLRHALEQVVQPHVTAQRDYHRVKAHRLHNVHRRLDKVAETFFILAIFSVLTYLMLKIGSVTGLVPAAWPLATSKLFTFLGIAFPTLGASIAGIRFFGDFERFAAISEIAAEKLDELNTRIALLLSGPERGISYGAVANVAHAIDEVVVDEIESWQSVFGGKHIALPA